MKIEKELKKLENKKNNLEKKDIDLIIADYDDTLFSTKELLENNYRKGKRGKEGNDIILKNNLINKIIKEVYENKNYPSVLASKLRKNHDLILTAGIEELQIKKLKATNLEHINIKVVNDANEKILETIKYVVNELGFIPNKITVYEDRPKFFIEYKSLIENFLGTELVLMLVEMIDNETEPKITKIK